MSDNTASCRWSGRSGQLLVLVLVALLVTVMLSAAPPPLWGGVAGAGGGKAVFARAYGLGRAGKVNAARGPCQGFPGRLQA